MSRHDLKVVCGALGDVRIQRRPRSHDPRRRRGAALVAEVHDDQAVRRLQHLEGLVCDRLVEIADAIHHSILQLVVVLGV